jgi:hypothetical protein
MSQVRIRKRKLMLSTRNLCFAINLYGFVVDLFTQLHLAPSIELGHADCRYDARVYELLGEFRIDATAVLMAVAKPTATVPTLQELAEDLLRDRPF